MCVCVGLCVCLYVCVCVCVFPNQSKMSEQKMSSVPYQRSRTPAPVRFHSVCARENAGANAAAATSGSPA